MKYWSTLFFCIQALFISGQEIIPFDTAHWNIQAQGYVLDYYEGKEAIYLNKGMVELRDYKFLNGTIEFDIFLTDRRSFPGIRFRAYDAQNAESFYFRNEQSGMPDANQATPVFNGISAWQLYFGPSYSFAYEYNFNVWTHVRIVVHGNQAQLYLDHSESPQLSWYLKSKAEAGSIMLGGSFAPMYYANFSVDPNSTGIKNFDSKSIDAIEGIIEEWNVSDNFSDKELEILSNIDSLFSSRIWKGNIFVEENNACNISRIATFPEEGLNTVLVKITIHSDRNQIKFLDFGYSDRAIVYLNKQPIYKGDNTYRSRDYRYLGTIGLFDGIFMQLNKGSNTLVMAVSERFGGWGVTGRILDRSGIRITTD